MTTEDGIEKIIGSFGKYQTFILLLITVGHYPSDFQTVNVVFILPDVNYVCLDETTFNLTNQCPCENPKYDETVIKSSVTSEWNLICNSEYLATLGQSILHVGLLAGSLFYGYVSDMHGRKAGIVLAMTSQVVFVAVSALVTKYWMFLVCRLLIGAAFGGTMICGYTYLMEISGKSFRNYMVGLHDISFISGYLCLPIIAYFVREWRDLQLVLSVPWLLVFVYYWLIPESPRWLITVGKKNEAIAVLTYIASKNNRPIENIESIVNDIEKESSNSANLKHGNILDLFRTSRIRKYTCINLFVWMSISHIYYGVTQYIGRLQGDLYLNVLLTAASLIPSLVLVVLGASYLKRKTSIITSFMLTALSLFLYIFIPNNMHSITLSLAIIGQMGAYASFTFVYLYSVEVFPTMVRTSGMGFCSVWARFGGFIAPFVVNIGVEWVSISIFSTVAFCAGLLCCFLPETKGIVLLNSIEQTEKSDPDCVQ